MISSPPPFATSSPGRRSAGSSRASISSRTTTSISGVDTNYTRYGHQQRHRRVDGVVTIHEQQFWPPSQPARRNNNSNASYSSARRPLPSLPTHLRVDRQASFLLSSLPSADLRPHLEETLRRAIWRSRSVRDGDGQYIPFPDVLCYHLVCACYCLCRCSWGKIVSAVVALLAARVDGATAWPLDISRKLTSSGAGTAL